MQREDQITTVYTIVYAAADSDRGSYPISEARGSYLSLAFAREELERQIIEEKAELDSRYDCEERNGDYWEMYQGGYAAAAYSRLQILATTLHRERDICPRAKPYPRHGPQPGPGVSASADADRGPAPGPRSLL